MNYISHPLIRPESIEERQYQFSIALRAQDGNTMVVLPTGLGKTAVATIAAAARMKSTGGRFLMMAPTKPLVDQHLKTFERDFIDPEDEAFSGFALFTGETKTSERQRLWREKRFIFATPQIIKNDIIAGRYSLKDVSLLVVDECHRAVGNYAYVFIAQEYMKTSRHPLILAMTASPGSQEDKVAEVCSNLDIQIIETRTEEDPDVRPYIHQRDLKYVDVPLPPGIKVVTDGLKEILQNRLDTLTKMSFVVPKAERLTMKALNGLKGQINATMRTNTRDAYQAMSIHAELMKIKHAITLGESQGSMVLKNYLFKLLSEGTSPSGTKAGKRLAADPLFGEIIDEASSWEKEIHPKPEIAAEIVEKQLEEFPDSRIIIFANYRDSVNLLDEYLKGRGIDCKKFIGQASRDSEKGLSQKKQIETLTGFRNGEFRVLIATSVGEEGLDVPSTDLVIFYEAVPSEIRSIQRKGRTGRHGSGSIIVLVTKGTSDETFRYVSQNREKTMKKGIAGLASATATQEHSHLGAAETGFGSTADTGSQESEPSRKGQISIDSFIQAGPSIIADDRETSSKVLELLHTKGASISLERLEYGDYAIGDRIIVERKTTRDFADSLIERDLLGQVKRMAEMCMKPVVIIEGEELYSQRNINPNAIRGALAAMSIGMGITIIQTKDAEDTAEMLYVLAGREESEYGPSKSPHFHKTYRSERESLEYVISSFPSIGPKNARDLLDHFGSIQDIMNANIEELKVVPGIGDKIAKSVFELSRKKYR
ncbi:helicase domain protein [Methanolacinia petrolearia DSM 11571]|uniref:Helicase domain protein n=1 Tax=Methanolacinia petrolearia (strain DSM 11571 / OCM 486 / SEBR 4847) TaxID=679926 RepID=E1RIX8_METP4|nr:DEAD/DEAH box helicase [Methanolacinia petrolearia]ADN35566.1 helicase domain protein [Methanolacinia petrolearia DSM 11571]